jgi:hypothetical protein
MIARHQRDVGGPRLVSSTGAWTYEDAAEHAAALRLDIELGINLATIDDWIEAGPWPDHEHLERVLAWRRTLLSCHLSGNADAAEGWGLYLLTLAAFNQREAFLHPLARRGVQHGKAQALRRKGKPAKSDYDAGRNKRICKHHARLVSEGHHDATAQTAAEFGLSARQVSRIVKAADTS